MDTGGQEGEANPQNYAIFCQEGTGLSSALAEGGGFEPPIRVNPV
jgi:hypothetical protein